MRHDICAMTAVLLVGLAGCGDAEFFGSNGGDGPTAREVDESTGDSEEADAPSGEFEPVGVSVGEAAHLEATGSVGEEGVTGEELQRAAESLASPIDVWRRFREDAADSVVTANIIERTVPNAIWVYVHSGGGTARELGSLPPGESREFVPAPKEMPSRFVDEMTELVESELREAGVGAERASRLVEANADELFREHGRRVIYIAPDQWTEVTGHAPLGAVEEPPQR